MYSLIITTAAVFGARGPNIPHPPSSSSGGLLAALAHAVAWGFGARAGARIASLFSPATLLVIALVAGGAYLLLRRRTRR